MAGGFLAHGADAELRRAVTTVEGVSSAEVVITVRRRSARWFHAHVIVGALVAFAALGFMLFDEHAFSLASIWIDPFLAGVAAGAAVELLPGLQRALTPRRARRHAVRRAARATFHARGVRRTRARTGLLVYVSLIERMAEIVPDDGIEAAAAADAWRAACHRIDRAVVRGGRATAEAIAALAELLGPCLPCGDDDINELPDDIDERAAEDDDADADAFDDASGDGEDRA